MIGRLIGMPKKAKELSATEVKRLTHAISSIGKAYNALHPVGGIAGLLLQVTPTNAKSWIYRTKVGTKRRNIGLGGYPDITLALARDKARELKEQITLGIDPVEAKKAAKRDLVTEQLSTITFKVAALEYIKKKAAEFKSPRQAKDWENTLSTYAFPIIGDIPVREIDLPHIKKVLDPIWETKTVTAARIRGRIENILGWCSTHGYRSEANPARWVGYLDNIYPSSSKIINRKHHASLPYEELAIFIKELQGKSGTAARALEFLILTASRTNEVIGDKRIGKNGITWGEVNLTNKIWTVPANRMKSGKEHKVPLSTESMAILESMPTGKPEDLIFSNPRGGIPSNNFLSSLLKRMGREITTHGFRSTFKDWAREQTSYADEITELALAHVNNDQTRAAYARSKLIERRRLLMQEWASFCNNGQEIRTTNVINIGK